MACHVPLDEMTMPTSLEQPAAKSSRKNLHPDDVRMSFGDHLEELRHRLILALIGVGVAALLTFVYGREIINWLQLPLHRAQVVLGMSPGTITTGVTAPFAIYMKVSLLAAAVLALPWVVYQIWKFVSAGLYAHERRVIYLIAPFSTTMTLLGIGFMYYFMLPVCLAFFLSFAASYPEAGGQEPGVMDRLTELLSFDALFGTTEVIDPEPPAITAQDSDIWRMPMVEKDPVSPVEGDLWYNRLEHTLKLQTAKGLVVFRPESSGSVHPLITLQEYISFVMYITVGILAGFQLPVIMTVAGWTGLIDPTLLSASRKYAVFIMFALSAVLTPADPLSMIVLAVPMCLLYEFGLFLMKRTYRAPEMGEEQGA